MHTNRPVRKPSYICSTQLFCTIVVAQGTKIADACGEASVKAFPTWIINGNATEGQLELDQLEKILQDAEQPAAAATATANEGAAVVQ